MISGLPLVLLISDVCSVIQKDLTINWQSTITSGYNPYQNLYQKNEFLENRSLIMSKVMEFWVTHRITTGKLNQMLDQLPQPYFKIVYQIKLLLFLTIF